VDFDGRERSGTASSPCRLAAAGVTAPVSVVVPTIGRPDRLAGCLQSLAACSPLADEILVVDQSRDGAIATAVAPFREVGVRLVPCATRGVGKARNEGLQRATHETVLVTDDDCTVAPEWVQAAWRLASNEPETLWTGTVLPVGDPLAVPSTIDDSEPYDYTGEMSVGALYPNNMVLNRRLALELGGFDDRVLYAEDNDFCYRWLRAGKRMRYDPGLVVWHHSWRTPEELTQTYHSYWRGQGLLYAKHLRRHDRTMLAFIARDVRNGLRGQVGRVVRRNPAWTDPRQGLFRGLASGLFRGWSIFDESKGESRSPGDG
jgi:GT2 family glycosyltransferase